MHQLSLQYRFQFLPTKRILAAVCFLSMAITVIWVLVITGGSNTCSTICSSTCASSRKTDTHLPDLIIDDESKTQQQYLLNQEFRLPRIVHFTSRSEMLRTEYLPIMQHWFAKNPHLDFYLWRDLDTTCLTRLRYPRWVGTFNGSKQLLQTPLERSDLARVLALHALGGLYLDLDTVSVLNLTHLFDRPIAGAMFATEPLEHASLLFSLEYLLSNAVMFSLPGHRFLSDYIRTIEIIARKESLKKRNNFDAPWITGPIVMKQVYEQYLVDTTYNRCLSQDCRVHLFSPEVFSPRFDPMQTSWLKTVCNMSTIDKLPHTKRNVCVRLWARNFTQATITNATLAVHMFSHISSVQTNLKPTYFNALEVFPRIKSFANSVSGC